MMKMRLPNKRKRVKTIKKVYGCGENDLKVAELRLNEMRRNNEEGN